jgi:hypothetical protein
MDIIFIVVIIALGALCCYLATVQRRIVAVVVESTGDVLIVSLNGSFLRTVAPHGSLYICLPTGQKICVDNCKKERIEFITRKNERVVI